MHSMNFAVLCIKCALEHTFPNPILNVIIHLSSKLFAVQEIGFRLWTLGF